MSIFQSLYYSIIQSVRNSKRSLSIMGGIMISVTLISGIFIAGEGLMSFGLQNGLDEVKFDWIIQPKSDVDQSVVEDAFLSVKNQYDSKVILNQLNPTITRVFQENPPQINGIPDSIKQQKGVYYNFTKYNNETQEMVSGLFEQLSIIGSSLDFLELDLFDDVLSFQNVPFKNLSKGEIFIDKQTALENNFEVGDMISLTGLWVEGNYSSDVCKIVGIVDILDVRELLTVFFPDDYILQNNNFAQRLGISENLLIQYLQRASVSKHYIFANLDFAQNLIANISSPTPFEYFDEIAIRYVISLHHENLPILDQEEYENYSEMIKTRFIAAIGSNDIIFEDNIATLINELESQFTIFETLSIIVSIPTILLGIFLTDTIYKLSLEHRRREFGLLKCRGATGYQNLFIYYFEAIIISLFGGIFGSLAGLGISYSIVSYILGDSYAEFLQIQPLAFNWELSIIITILGMMMTLLSIRKPIKDFAQKTVIEVTSRYDASESQKPLHSKLDWVALMVGLFPIGLLLVEDSLPTFSGIVRLLFNLVTTLSKALTWIAPFLLIYAIVRLFAGRSIKRLAYISEKIAAIFMKEKSSIIAQNITRNPRRTTRLVFIISVTLCFGLSSTIVTESQRNYEYEQVYVQIGADIRIQTAEDQELEFAEELLNFSSDIRNISSVSSYPGYLLGSSNTRINVYEIEPESYLSVSNIKEKYALSGDPQETLRDLPHHPNGTIISEQWANDLGFSIGDSIIITFSLVDNTIQTYKLKIIGFLEILPGITLLNALGSHSILVNHEFHTQFPNNVSGLHHTHLLDITENPITNATYVGQELSNYYLNEISSIRVFEDTYSHAQDRQGAFVSSIDFMAFQFPFLLVIATLGVLVVTYLSIYEKRHEMALMRVRGTLKSGLLSLQMGEATVLLILGIILGSLGFFMAWIMNLQLDSLDPFSQITGLNRQLILPGWSIALQFGAVTIIFCLTTFIATYIESKKSDIGQIGDLLRNY